MKKKKDQKGKSEFAVECFRIKGRVSKGRISWYLRRQENESCELQTSSIMTRGIE